MVTLHLCRPNLKPPDLYGSHIKKSSNQKSHIFPKVHLKSYESMPNFKSLPISPVKPHGAINEIAYNEKDSLTSPNRANLSKR